MTHPCDRRNPLARAGTNQQERILPGLKSDYFQVDERSLPDLLMFAQRFSRHIRYYGASGQVDNWFPFFGTQVTALLANIKVFPISIFTAFSNSLNDFLQDKTPQPPNLVLSHHFKLWFHLPFMLAREMGILYDRLPGNHPFRKFLLQLAVRDLKEPLRVLTQFYKGAHLIQNPDFWKTPLNPGDYHTDPNTTPNDIPFLPLPVQKETDTQNGLPQLQMPDTFAEELWGATWETFYTATTGNSSPFSPGPGVPQRIIRALNFNLLMTPYHSIFQTFQRMMEEGKHYFEASINKKNDHDPHYALWLAFLKLFQHNQAHLNGLTQRHLDYYYKEILQMAGRKAEADKVHLLLKLKKNSPDQLLTQGTEFKAGKDNAGNQVIYELDEDFVVNQGEIDQLKSLLILEEGAGATAYAFHQTNSLDGQGEKLSKEQPQWKPFGRPDVQSHARIGFAVADRQLFLREGMRTITLTLTLDAPISFLSPVVPFKIFLTGEEEWLAVDSSKITVTHQTIGSIHELKIEITLEGQDPAIIPYDPSLHEGKFKTSWAIARLEFDFSSPENFSKLRNVTFKNIQLEVAVNGARNFFMQNENGVLDTSKPFLPFGSAPEAGSFFILGSSELFSKQLNNIQLKAIWKEAFNGMSHFIKLESNSYSIYTDYLENGFWQRLKKPSSYQAEYKFSEQGNSKDFIEPSGPRRGSSDEPLGTLLIAVNLPATQNYSIEQSLENLPYSSDSTVGFVKISIDQGFGHQEYNKIYTLALIKQANPKSSFDPILPAYRKYNIVNGIPLEPYTPEITDISLNYSTVPAEPEQFFHIHPFGHKEENAAGGPLFPPLPNEGELYIGIKNLAPPQKLSMLFHTLEGSSNPLKKENTLQWHFLQGNEWVEVKRQFISDKTANLSGTGIIAVGIPEEADTQHDILPGGLHWLRMSVTSDTDALNDLLSIRAQAVTATFCDRNNADDFLETPLAAGTISKLKTSIGTIQTIEQPLDSFGGKPVENETHYYRRVSERLRHKDRAVTLWDYENLILEQFPEVYRVRCINHTQLCRDEENRILADNEMRPGHVLVIPISYINPKTALNPRHPYTRRDLLSQIDRFLRKRISPFVQLEVQNPKFEEVQVSFEVAFNENIADMKFYEDKLNSAIVQHLTPWAYRQGADISFGGQWHKSAIINFIEEQPYVHFIKNFEMYHKVDIDSEDSAINFQDTEVVVPTTARSILVSHHEHTINPIE